MLIRLIPVAPDPTVLFAITFQNLPDTLPNPLLWTSQLNCLTQDDLETPKDLHALDKSAAIPSLLEEVTFDLNTLTINCQFIDGSTEEWPLMGAGCMKALENVLNDVNESSLETEREMEREKEKEREQERERGKLLELMSPAPPVKARGHKKQRSLLMTFVASLVSSSSFPPRAPTPPLPVPEITPSASLPRTTPSLSPRALRRRARSALVDTFRRHVLPELTIRIPPGGYYIWVAQSMLRRASDRMAELVQQAGGEVPDLVQSRGLDTSGYFPDPSTFLPPSPFYDDEEGEGSDDTDTDGSSVHTPSSSHFNTMNSSFNTQHSVSSSRSNGKQSCSSQSIFSPHQALCPEDLAEYTAFSALTLRLRQVILLANARNTHEDNEAKHRETVLEIRGRRRAWLNKTLVGGVRGGNRDIGLAMPFASSPLGRHSWSSDDYELADYHEETEEEYEDRIPLGLRRSRGGESRLFPVCEEDEEDQAFVARELELELGLDLEGGMAWKGDEEGMSFEIERPQIRPRMRTRSMHRHRLDVQTPLELGVVPPPHLQHLAASSILCQPLTKPCEMDMAMERPPAYSEVDVGGLEVGYMYGGYPEEEFTLAMDLPFSVRRQDRGAVRRGHGLGGVSGAAAVHRDGWMGSGPVFSQDIDCR